MILLLISFVAGILTLLAPCILPLLPVVIGGSLADGKPDYKKALTIILSLGISVLVFTFVLKVSTLFINIPESFWKIISGGLIVVIGLVMVFPKLWENQFMAKLNAKSNMMLGAGNRRKSFWGDVIVGASLGPVFSTCSPTYFIVLATVLPVSLTLGITYLLAYIIGLCGALFLVTLVGQRLIAKLDGASDPNGWVKKAFGVLFLLVGVAILFGFDKKLQTTILENGFFDVTTIEQKLLQYEDDKKAQDEKNARSTDSANSDVTGETAGENGIPSLQTVLGNSADKNNEMLTLAKKAKMYDKAKELSTIDGYINTGGKPIKIADYKGKVVLLDIWTYSCINCQRTIPYLKTWYTKYEKDGLVIIGLHTPEFAFEKVQKNVEDAVKKFGIEYPVVLDNDYSTWNDYGNRYWPRKYLIDIDGYIVYDHIGEGDYDVTEKEIQKALKERADRMNTNFTAGQISKDVPIDPTYMPGSTKPGSPEIYFGFMRNQYFANGNKGVEGDQVLSVPSTKKLNELYLGGTWNVQSEFAASKSANAQIVYTFEASKVYMVASSDVAQDIEIYIDGVFSKKVTVQKNELYTLVNDTKSGQHLLEIKVPKAGFNAFTFTFG